MYTLKQAAEMCQVHDKTLRKYIRLGKLQATRAMGKHGLEWTVTEEALIRAGFTPSVRTMNDYEDYESDAHSTTQGDYESDEEQADNEPTKPQLMTKILEQGQQLAYYEARVNTLESTLSTISRVYEDRIEDLKTEHQRHIDLLIQERDRERERALAELTASREQVASISEALNTAMVEVAETRHEIQEWVRKSQQPQQPTRPWWRFW